MIKAASLYLVIVISFIVALLSASIILLGYYTRQATLRHDLQERVALNIVSGTTLILSGSNTEVTYESRAVDLFGDQLDSITVSISGWGLFNLGSCTAGRNPRRQTSAFLYGAEPAGPFTQALYLADLSSPLTLSGSSQIRGGAMLPGSGIRAGTMDGKSYEGGDSLVQGAIKTGGKELPSVQRSQLARFHAYLDGTDTSLLRQASGDLLKRDTLNQSFLDSTLYLVSKKKIILDHKYLKGHILIYSHASITVTASTVLTDVLLVAPVIQVNAGVKGNFQAFASDSLLVGPRCLLRYPSCLVLLKDSLNRGQPLLQVDSQTTVRGCILTQVWETGGSKTYVRLDRSSVVGVVYVAGYLELRGKVSGTVLTDHFMYRSPTTSYENMLYNGSINRKSLDPRFLEPLLFSKKQHHGIICPVY